MTNKQMCKQISDYIKEHGWCQGQYEKDTGEVCLAGACDALGIKKGRLALTCALEYSGIAGGYVSFNDKPGRTKEEVLAVLDNFANSPD